MPVKWREEQQDAEREPDACPDCSEKWRDPPDRGGASPGDPLRDVGLLPRRATQDSDGALVRACLTGDRGAWEALIHRYERLIYSIPLRCGLAQEDAADVFQTVCVRLIENLEALRDHERLAAWLITTANRESWRVHRENRRQVPLLRGGPGEEEESTADDIPATDPLPHETVVRLEEEQIVRQAVQDLGDRCRTLLTWLYYTDPAPAYADLARRLEVPEGSIGPTRARCLQQLKKLLQKCGF